MKWSSYSSTDGSAMEKSVCVSLGGILGTIINYVFSTDGLNIYAY